MAKKKNNKKPPWWRPLARLKWNAMEKAYREVQARVLPPEEAREYEVELPTGWYNKSVNWILGRLGGGGKKGVPPGSGYGLVQSPYASVYTRTYGVDPIKDLKKYRIMFRNHPDIQEAVELQVTLAIGRGFNVEHPRKEVEEYLKKFVDEINLLQVLLILAKDCLVYGNAYGEIIWDEQVEKTESMYQYNGTRFTASEVEKLNIKGAKPIFMASATGKPVQAVAQVIGKGKKARRVIGIKPLDPVYMRVRRDSFGNVYGYLQTMTVPNIVLDTNSIIHIKYRPTSTGYESAYGRSILMSLVKNTELLEQFENDAAVWIHSRAVPPLIIKGGTEERPYTTSQMKSLMKALSTRSAASMYFVKGDVTLEEIKSVARNMNIDWWLNYLMTRRFQALGVPRVLMGLPEGTNRAVAEVVFQDFVTRLQLLQSFIGDAIETQVLHPIVKAVFGEDTKKPKMVWKPIVEESRDMRSQRLIQLLQARAISVNEIRTRLGFDKLDDPIYDEVGGAPVGTKPQKVPTGMPKVPGWAKPPPEGVPKKESLLTPEQEFRVKKLRLLVNQEQFKNELLRIVDWTKFELKQGNKLVKDIKKEAMEKAKGVINKYVQDAYLYGKIDVKTVGSLEDLTIKKDDLPGIAKLKKQFVKDFRKIVNDMVKAKEKGLI